MKQYKISIIIPARSEMFLKNTVEDILKNKESETEIIVGLDGEWSNPTLVQHPDLSVIYVPESIGQRAISKMCARLSKAKYIAKVDAHCSFDKGFDRKMLEAFTETGDNVVMVPIMKNLHAFDWKCTKCGKKTYQGPMLTECQEKNYKKTGKQCPGTKFIKKIVWEPRRGSHSTSYCIDSTSHFQYFNDYCQRPEYKEALEKTGLTESMSLQGSFFMMTREKYFDLDVDNEDFGSWGGQGFCVAASVWLSGGRVIVNHRTWYSHMFRTQKDFSFPYPQSGRQVEKNKQKIKNLFWSSSHPKQIRPLSWLVEKFLPIPTWDEKAIKELKESGKKNLLPLS